MDGRLIFVYLFQYELLMVGLYLFSYFNMNYGWQAYICLFISISTMDGRLIFVIFISI